MKPKKKPLGQLFEYTPSELKNLLDQALSIDDSSPYAIDKAMKDHSRIHNEWSAVASRANKWLNIEELKLKQVYAEEVAKIRKEHAKGGKPLAQTYPVDKELLPLSERWIKANEKIIDLKELVDVLSGVERRFNNRAWLLIQIAKGREGEGFEPTSRGRKRGESKEIQMEEYDL